MIAWLVAGAGLCFVAGEEVTAEEIASGTLLRSWDQAWLRVFDRSGRPDPDGPMLQRFEPPMDERYQLDLRTTELPSHLERLWARQRNGARLWVQSLSEVDLGNQAEFRLELSTWEDGYVGLRYDRREDWNHSRNLLRFEIGQRAIADTGASAALRIHPRLEKDDIDVEAIVGYRAPGWGAARLRVAALDPFINASFGLIEAKGKVPDEDVRQLDPPLALAIEAGTEWLAGTRAEVYAGAVLPQTRRHRFARDPEEDHRRRRRALLGAALLEWRIPGAPAVLGAAAQIVDARMQWAYRIAPTQDRAVTERTLSARAYTRARPRPDLRIDGSLSLILRPEWWEGAGVPDTTRDDREWLLSVRALWMPGSVGLDLRYLGIHRRADGPPPLPVDGRVNRVMTHIALKLAPDLWTSFGAAWTFDAGTGVYDRAGMTLLYTPR